MKTLLSFSFLVLSLTARGTIAHRWLENFQKVLIETLPVNRFFIENEGRVFSFELPLGFHQVTDTFEAIGNAQKFGLRHDFFLGSFLGESNYFHKDENKVFQSYWALNMCGHDTYPSQYPQNFCSERETGDAKRFREMQLRAQAIGNDIWSNSLMALPFLQNPWMKIPHFEYRQCFRYAQSLLLTFLKLDSLSKRRFVHAKITTIIPTPRDYATHYFDYWSTTFSPVDILRLKRLMHSIQFSQSSQASACFNTPLVRVYQPTKNYQQFIQSVFFRIFAIDKKHAM